MKQFSILLTQKTRRLDEFFSPSRRRISHNHLPLASCSHEGRRQATNAPLELGFFLMEEVQ